MRVLALLLFSLVLARADNAALDAWLKRQGTITSLDCGFIQERKLPSLKQPIVTPGRLSFAKPGKLRWQLGEPAQTLAVSDGTTLVLIEEADKSARKVPADSPKAARFSMLSGKAFQDPAAFTEAFEIIESRVVSGIHQYTLKAKDRSVRSQVPWIFLDIDPAKNELRAMEMELQDKSRVRTVFQQPRFNVKLADSMFTPDLSGYAVK